jgi:hypothetical protein
MCNIQKCNRNVLSDEWKWILAESGPSLFVLLRCIWCNWTEVNDTWEAEECAVAAGWVMRRHRKYSTKAHRTTFSKRWKRENSAGDIRIFCCASLSLSLVLGLRLWGRKSKNKNEVSLFSEREVGNRRGFATANAKLLRKLEPISGATASWTSGKARHVDVAAVPRLGRSFTNKGAIPKSF